MVPCSARDAGVTLPLFARKKAKDYKSSCDLISWNKQIYIEQDNTIPAMIVTTIGNDNGSIHACYMW